MKTKSNKLLPKKTSDPKHLGIPNINFSIYTEGDKREFQFAKERVKRGFDESETWSLCNTIVCFALPRMKAYRDIVIEVNKDGKQQANMLDKIIEAFELVKKDDTLTLHSEKGQKKYKEGMKLFSENFLRFWW